MQRALREHVLKASFYKQRLAGLDILVLASVASSLAVSESCSGPRLPLHWDNIWMSSSLVMWLAPPWKSPLWSLLFSWKGCLDMISLPAGLKSRRTFFGSWCETNPARTYLEPQVTDLGLFLLKEHRAERLGPMAFEQYTIGELWVQQLIEISR